MFELFGISRLELTRHLYGVLTTPSTMHNRRSMSNVMCTVFRFIAYQVVFKSIPSAI